MDIDIKTLNRDTISRKVSRLNRENNFSSRKRLESIVPWANSSGRNIPVSQHRIARYIQCANILCGLPRFYESISLLCIPASCSGKR